METAPSHSPSTSSSALHQRLLVSSDTVWFNSLSLPIFLPLSICFLPIHTAIFEVDTNSFSDGEGIDREGAQDYILLFDSCQRKFCFEINLKDGIQRPESGSFGISVARTPDHGRSTTLNPKLTLGNIIVG